MIPSHLEVNPNNIAVAIAVCIKMKHQTLTIQEIYHLMKTLRRTFPLFLLGRVTQIIVIGLKFLKHQLYSYSGNTFLFKNEKNNLFGP